ncbi:MAG: CIA30 family protein [Planctomycetes bacterium]|nr:CIA30 family protein [Planctomycetota bacterium]
MNARTLFDFTLPNVSPWRGVYDVVMGGRSDGGFSPGDGFATFSGVLSLENHGGFASIRAGVDTAATAGTSGIALRVRGDGRGYLVTLKQPPLSDVGVWKCAFATRAGEWIDVSARWEDFERSLHGRVDPSWPAPVPGRIAEIGLMIADGRAGAYRLDIETIRPVAS